MEELEQQVSFEGTGVVVIGLLEIPFSSYLVYVYVFLIEL